MANYLDMMFSDPQLAKKLAAGPMDPNAFNLQLDTVGGLNSPSFAQALGTGAVTPTAPVEAVAPVAPVAPVDPAAPVAPAPKSPPTASGAVNPAMLSALMAATKPTAQPHTPAAGSPAAGKGFTPLAATGKQGGSVAPGFFKALYGK